MLAKRDVEVSGKGGKVTAEQISSVERQAPSVSIKYIFAGAIFSAFVYVGVLVGIYILNDKLCISDELQVLYNIFQLGVIVRDSKEQFLVDRWIDALRNHGKYCFTREQSLELAAVAEKLAAIV